MNLIAEKSLESKKNDIHRRKTREVMVGKIGVGGSNPIRVQSMTITPTMDTEATVKQVLSLVNVGCEIVRITAPTTREAQNLGEIKNELIKQNCDVPLAADIHFRPDAALVAADFVEKVRINPGNFADGKAFKIIEYTEKQYQDELNRIEERFTPLLEKIKKNNKALRIGTNHGSLSDRIMNRYGDTPLGMVESALEFTRICRKHDFHDIIFSMKASNPRVMIAAYRLLAERLDGEGWDYPFHLGVTEAGDGEDGRIKSAVGIGSLLEDGIGDTIRVSLTEDPEYEIPVAQEIANRYSSRWNQPIPPYKKNGYVLDRFSFNKRETNLLNTGPIQIGGSSPIRIHNKIDPNRENAQSVLEFLETRLKSDTPPEILEIPYSENDFETWIEQFKAQLGKETSRLSVWVGFLENEVPNQISFAADAYSVVISDETSKNDLKPLVEACQKNKATLVLKSESIDSLVHWDRLLKGKNIGIVICVLGDKASDSVHVVRALTEKLNQNKSLTPLFLDSKFGQSPIDQSIVQGSLICDGIGDIISMNSQRLDHPSTQFGYNLLQACGTRLTKTEYVSCPSCGRTLFDLQSTTERIKSKTGHLKGVKIAIMGCIVNGPGEMADADFGYVGGGPGKINLYVGKTCVEKSIPSQDADQRLIDLIKSHGKWVEPN